MKLYDAAMPAPNPRRVRMYLAEKGIKDVPLVPINILKGESRAADSLARNPFGGIPYLELDDGTVLSESVAIDRKSTRLNSSHANISYAVFCWNKKSSRY